MRIPNPIVSVSNLAWWLPADWQNRPGSLARLVAAVMRWRERARERRQLMAMSDRELRDIRLTRVDAWREASKPLWRE